MSQPRPTDPIGSIGWTERTGGVLTARECLTLAGPLLQGELSILAGRLAMALRMHSDAGVPSIRRAWCLPTRLSLRAEAKQVPRGRAWYLHRFAMSDLSIRLAPFRG
jgi:hypothetical protein